MSCERHRPQQFPIQFALDSRVAPAPPAVASQARKHAGKQIALIERHRRDAMRYDLLNEVERQRLHDDLLNRWADTRTLFAAVEKRARSGPKAAGPNGERLERLLRTDRHKVWSELRRLSAAILDGSYRPSPARLVSIPKSSGRGARQIAVANWQDAAVAAAGALVLQPLIEWHLPETCLAFRPDRDVTSAIALADALIRRENRYALLTLDLENAFDNVPHGPLLTRLRQLVGNDSCVELIVRIVGNGTGRGIPQGCALSPLCLNVLLADAVLAKVEREHPNVPLLQYADDLLVLCLSEEEAHDVRDSILRHVNSLGMALKPTPAGGLCDLRRGDAVTWLGYTLKMNGGNDAGRQTEWDLPLDWERDLRDDLSAALEKGDGLAKCRALLLHHCRRLGPLERARFEAAKRDLFRACEEVGITESVKEDEVNDARGKEFARYRALRDLLRTTYTGRNDDQPPGAPPTLSATQAGGGRVGEGLEAADGHGSAEVQNFQPTTADQTAAPPATTGGAARFSDDIFSTTVHFRIFSTRSGLFGWAARAVDSDGRTIFTKSGGETSTTFMRCCLKALRKLFRALVAADRLHARLWFTDPRAFQVAEQLFDYSMPTPLDLGTARLRAATNTARIPLHLDLQPRAFRATAASGHTIQLVTAPDLPATPTTEAPF